ncbi:unnamed protein product [Paramecium pentaurelia]|uniref:Uncharacterized protein n=1 Tax=Paramecium pentaurelia TaxID=43138 RepID=A0A8S1WN91_9CILI|nr:unnamed protein product [Paramecium pentaurelia]
MSYQMNKAQSNNKFYIISKKKKNKYKIHTSIQTNFSELIDVIILTRPQMQQQGNSQKWFNLLF